MTGLKAEDFTLLDDKNPRQVEAAESGLRALGIVGNLRVRHHGDLARVEVDRELLALLERRGAAVLHAPAIRIVPLADDTKLLARGERRLDDLSEAQTVSGHVEGNADIPKLHLHLVLLRPSGEIAAEKILDWNANGQQARRVSGAALPAQ